MINGKAEEMISTIAGPFTRQRTEDLRKTLNTATKELRGDEEVIKFEGNDLVIKFGKYLLEFLDSVWETRK